MRLDINYREKKKKKTAKNTNSWRLNNTLLNNKDVTEEIRKEIKRFLESNDNENTTAQNLWDSAKAALRGRFIDTIILQETRKAPNRQPNTASKAVEKRRTKNLQGQQKEGDNKNPSRNK